MPVPSLTTPADPAATQASPAAPALAQAELLEVPPNNPFFFVFYPDHPRNWRVGVIEPGDGVPDEDVGAWWLPVLQHEPVRPGVNNHRTVPKDAHPSTAWSQAHELIRQQGGIVLDEQRYPAQDYMSTRDCIHPLTKRQGIYHSTVWNSPRVKLRGKRLKESFDWQRYNRWLLALMRDGVLPLPDPQIVSIERGRFAERIARREALELERPASGGEHHHVVAAKRDAGVAHEAKVLTMDSQPTRRRRGR